MAVSKEKLRILNQVKQNEAEFEQFVQDCLSSGECSYGDVVTHNAHATGSVDLDRLMQLVSHVTQSQNDKEAVWVQLSGNQPYFYHFDGTNTAKTKAGEIECRLYLNLKAKNIVPFASAFVDKCEKHRLPYRFKIAVDDVRNDNIPIYTSYANAQKFLDVIAEIEKESPALFDGAENMGVMTGKIGKFVGFGEECVPTDDKKKVSFNSARAKVLGEYVDKINDIALKELFAPKVSLRTSKGDKMSVDDYVISKIQAGLSRSASRSGIDVTSAENEKRIKAQLGKVYESIIELESKNIDFDLKDGNGNEQIERLDTAPIVEKIMSVFRVNKNADKNVQKLAVAQKIIESRLPDRLVVSESANALTYLEKIFGQKIEIMLQDKKDYLTASRTPTFDYDIALSRIKSKSNYGKLAIRKAIVQYLMQLDNPQSTHIPLDVDLSASGVQIVLGGLEKTEIEREILQGYNSSVLEVHDREKSRLLPAVFREENVSVTFPFLNLTTEIELKQLFARKPNLKIK